MQYILFELAVLVGLCFLLSLLTQCGFTYFLMKRLYGKKPKSPRKNQKSTFVSSVMGFPPKSKRKPKVIDDARALEIERRQQQKT